MSLDFIHDAGRGCPTVLPIVALIATRNRAESLAKVFDSLREQSAQPSDVIVIDGSEDDRTEALCSRPPEGFLARLEYRRAEVCGAAPQRNQAAAAVQQPVVWFLDDDIVFEPQCVANLYSAFAVDPDLGGVNAMITNQRYHSPGRLSRFIYAVMAGKRESTWAGRVIGPAVNFLPDDRDDLPEVAPVEWLNTTCTMYRREALPMPPFPTHFMGYSFMEDLALSLVVARTWKLANIRTARIVHNSQPGVHKSNPVILAEMELVNRHFVMTKIMGRRRVSDYLKLLLYEAFSIASHLRAPESRRAVIPALLGRARAIKRILSGIPE